MSAASGTVRGDVLIHLEREYHVGAGHGRGAALDSALFTDFQGDAEEPAIRYGHGVLRQAVYDLLQVPLLDRLRHCQASGKAAGPPWCAGRGSEAVCPVCRIFGSPALPSPWSFGTLRPKKRDRSPSARVVSRASADPRRRRAADKTLFSEELGAPLTFTMAAERVARNVDDGLDELALLAAAARAVPAIGADRRRGRGECSIEVVADAPGAGDLLKRFREAWLAAGHGEPRAAAAGRAERPAFEKGEIPASLWTEAEEAEQWVEVHLVVRLDEPVIAGSRPLTGNVLQSELYVPGGMLLGALAGRALAGGAAEDEAAFLCGFRAGCVRFPDLLPVEERGDQFVPTLPAPRDLYTCSRHRGPRATGGHGVWSALQAGDDEGRCPDCRKEGKEAKPERLKGFLVPLPADAGKGTRWTLDLEAREETKIQVDPRTGRVHGSSLYHRQTIPAGTLLAGTLLATPRALDHLRRWLNVSGDAIELRLGKRHGRGYGAARLAWIEPHTKDLEARRTAVRQRIKALVDAGVPIPLVALSRVLLRDALGRVRQSLSPEDLGLPGTGDCAVVARQVGGYWRHIGLPRQQEQALEPGSVLLVAARGEERGRLLEGLIALAEGRAMGERTAEGFGRVAVAPFPYGWYDERYASEDPAFLPCDIPESLRPKGALRGDPLRRDPRAQLTAEYEARLRDAGINPDRDEWRTVARLLYARAGDEAVPLLRALEEGGGAPLRALTAPDLKGSRSPTPFLGKEGAGHPAWLHLRPLVDEAAGADREELRALRTRALADALAQLVHPAKGRE
jgi:hypothetical protein